MPLKRGKALRWLLAVLAIAAVVLLLWFLLRKDNTLYSIDQPYEYPLEYGSEAWHQMEPRQRQEAYSVPQEIIDSMTTQALLYTVLDNPFLSDAWAYSTSEEMVEVVLGLNGARGIDGAMELMAREDFKQELDRASQTHPEEKTARLLELLELVYNCHVLGNTPGF